MRLMLLALALLLTTSTTAFARTDRQILSDWFRERGHTLEDLRIAGDWALGTASWKTDGGGMVLFRKTPQGWEMLQSGGGAMDVTNLDQLAVPSAVWGKLIPGQPGRDRVAAARAEPTWVYLSRTLVSQDDLRYQTDWELTLARNEIFARHGRVFQDPMLRAYFGARRWYRPDPRYTDARLTRVERANVDRIAAWQAAHPPKYLR